MKPDILNKVGQRLHAEVSLFYQTRASLEGSNRQQRRQNLISRVGREPRLRHVIDEACRHWIANGKWPHMETVHAMLVADRLGEAVMTAGWLYQNGFRCPGKTVNEVLAFLLIEHWAVIGKNLLVARAAMSH